MRMYAFLFKTDNEDLWRKFKAIAAIKGDYLRIAFEKAISLYIKDTPKKEGDKR